MRWRSLFFCVLAAVQAGCLRLSYDLCEGETPHPECAALDAGRDAGKDGGELDEDAGAPELDASMEDASIEDGSTEDAALEAP